ncbi:LexA family transcriptional regulator [Fulvivirga maritima]|uniref:XRE family transcriptional regulator n=1 Tax=Fulvivirga maritima TaxID=2904247 RepID=UPI001F3A98EC|nr:LexA family transcriptional regulator [Fulvivirga maritima]UII26457.1 LexA family transcriptional regulator [Fulvivirga maritima]
MRDSKLRPQRVTMLRELLQMSQVKFAEKINISQGALSQIENGKSQISLETLRSISNELQVNCNWLVNGTGDIFQQDEEEAYEEVRKSEKVSIQLVYDGQSIVPFVKEEAHAGYINGYDDPSYLQTLDVYKIPGYQNGNYRLFEIEGESMTPTIFPREIVICSHIENRETIENGTLCVIVTKEGIVAKRVYFYENDNQLFILKSDNSKFKTYSIQDKKVLEIWKIEAKITTVFVESGLVDAKRIEKLENNLETLRREVRKLTDTPRD